MTDTTALALAAAVAATPLVVWAARLAPRRAAGTRANRARLARARADRELWRLIRTRCTNPGQCPTCTAHAHRAEGTHP
ncbi:hypothetical protein ACFQ7B_00280 [Streptomyces erythrochromogenes]|uniref:hypothetical protein n=1 Tax=Streptomyces erythrochromogenes TaxID=285574 RepID=UPI0036A224B1